MSYDTLISNAVANFRQNTRHLFPEKVEEDFIKLMNLFIPYYLSGKTGETIDIIMVFIGIKPLCNVLVADYDKFRMSFDRHRLFSDTIDISDTFYGRQLTEEEEDTYYSYEWINKIYSNLIILCQRYGLIILDSFDDDDIYNVVICWKNNIVDALIFNDQSNEIVNLPFTSIEDVDQMIFDTFQSILLGYNLESSIGSLIESAPTLSPEQIGDIWNKSLLFIEELRKNYIKNIPTIL